MPSAKVCVWPDKNMKGWDGNIANPAIEFPVVDLVDALLAVYDTDAHFTLGVVHPTEQPRLKKYRENGGTSALKAYRDIGLDPSFGAIAVDVDRPEKFDNDPDAWWDNQVVLLGMSPTWEVAGWYRTKGGYRLVWYLENPVKAEEYEVLQKKLANELLRVGVNQDHLPDWTRCFRLPYVSRDGIQQVYPCDFSKMDYLPVDKLSDLPDIKKIAHSHISTASPWDQDLTEASHNRNKGLLKLAIMMLKGCPDMPDDLLDIFVRGVHDTKCDVPLTDSELTRIINNARRYRPEARAPEVPVAAAEASETEDDTDKGGNAGFAFGARRQVLVVPGEMVRALDDTLDVFSNNKGCIYNMGGGLMRLRRDVEEFLQFEEIPIAALRTVVERMIEYVAHGKKDSLVAIDAPKDLIQMLAVMSDYGSNIWKLQEILTTPTLRTDGTPIIRSGYHEDLLTYLDCPEELNNLDLSGDPIQAFEMVKDLLYDIPFESEQRPGPKFKEHAAVAMTSFITPIVRTAIEGPIPLVLFDSSVRGAGKGLLADITSILATGRRAVIQPYVNETEFEKRVTALLQTGVRTVVIDNIDRPFGGPTLDALLTADMWTGRVLGETKMIKFRSRAHWMATGVSIQIMGDLDRRALRCYLSPNMENPEKRDSAKYKYPEVLRHVKAHRRDYVQAILTFMSHYIRLGCPKASGQLGLGSFEEWSRVVRGAVMHYGMADPVMSQDALRADGTISTWGLTLNTCSKLWGANWFSAREMYDVAFRQGAGGAFSKADTQKLEAGLEELLGSGQPTVRAVGFIMKRWLNRVVDGKKLVKCPQKDRMKGHVYRVEEVKDGLEELVS